jgi:hypothetical protein
MSNWKHSSLTPEPAAKAPLDRAHFPLCQASQRGAIQNITEKMQGSPTGARKASADLKQAPGTDQYRKHAITALRLSKQPNLTINQSVEKIKEVLANGITGITGIRVDFISQHTPNAYRL